MKYPLWPTHTYINLILMTSLHSVLRTKMSTIVIPLILSYGYVKVLSNFNPSYLVHLFEMIFSSSIPRFNLIILYHWSFILISPLFLILDPKVFHLFNAHIFHCDIFHIFCYKKLKFLILLFVCVYWIVFIFFFSALMYQWFLLKQFVVHIIANRFHTCSLTCLIEIKTSIYIYFFNFFILYFFNHIYIIYTWF